MGDEEGGTPLSINAMDLFTRLAQFGTAPPEGCALFGVGYDDAFERLKSFYIQQGFSRGSSAEKFVAGPYGSGKTHFLRQLMEIAREQGCVTSEVALNKEVDFTDGLVVYQELARGLRVPGSSVPGIRPFLRQACSLVAATAEGSGGNPEELLSAWASGLSDSGLPSEPFARVARKAVRAHMKNDEVEYEAACRWLAGEVADRALAKSLGESLVPSSQHQLHARHARLSLFQLVRAAGFPGTVVCFDEAEQGMDVDKKKTAKIFSRLLSEINALIDSPGASALVVYGVTPDVIEKIGERLPALKQRIDDPAPGQGFFSGTTTAPTIDLTQRDDPVADLERIAKSLTGLFYDRIEGAGDASPRAEALAKACDLATQVAAEEPSSSARRVLVKRVCSGLLDSLPGAGPAPAEPPPEAEV